MPPPNPHYALSLINHETGERLKIEMVDLPLPGARSYRIRDKRRWAHDSSALAEILENWRCLLVPKEQRNKARSERSELRERLYVQHNSRSVAPFGARFVAYTTRSFASLHSGLYSDAPLGLREANYAIAALYVG